MQPPHTSFTLYVFMSHPIDSWYMMSSQSTWWFPWNVLIVAFLQTAKCARGFDRVAAVTGLTISHEYDRMMRLVCADNWDEQTSQILPRPHICLTHGVQAHCDADYIVNGAIWWRLSIFYNNCWRMFHMKTLLFNSQLTKVKNIKYCIQEYHIL